MMATMLRFSLNQMVDRRRIALVSILALIPVGLMFIISQRVEAGDSLDPSPILDGLVIAGVLPLIVMALATSAFGNELEDRTLNNLVLKPVSRVLIVLPKMAASMIVAVPIVLLAGVAVTALALGAGGAGVDTRAVLAASAAILAGAVAYATLFTWLGLATARALPLALVYVFLWEGILVSFVSGTRYLSIRGYALGILYGLDDQTFAAIGNRAIELPAAAAGAVLVTIAFALLTIRRLQKMDVP